MDTPHSPFPPPEINPAASADAALIDGHFAASASTALMMSAASADAALIDGHPRV